MQTRFDRKGLCALALLAAAAVCAGAAFLQSPVAAQDEPTEGKAEGKTAATTTVTPEREVSANIDREIAKIWERDKIKPSGQSSDEEFVRRVYLDTVGMPPTADEVLAFIADKDKEKRRKLIDKLLADRRFGEHIANQWGLLLLGRSGRDFNGASHMFAQWLSERVNADEPFSDIVYDVVTAKGSLSENPAVAVYAREATYSIANAAGNLTKSLTGVQIQCAECHDHPYEEAWTEQTFTGVASFWAPVTVRVNNRSYPVDPVVNDNAPAPRIRRAPNAEAQERLMGLQRYNAPATIDGEALKTPNRQMWRQAMAQWMTSKENKQTARYMANRFWSFVFGIGLLNPIDDFNSFNEASHPELLEYLGADLIENKYDLKRMFRVMLNSNTYQLTSRDKAPKAELWHFASAPVRQLSPEQFFGAFQIVASGATVSGRTRGGDLGDQLRRRVEVLRKRGDAQNSYDDEALERFVETLSRIDNSWYQRRTMAQGYARMTSDDEMSELDGFSVTIDQALLVMNGDLTATLSASGRGGVLVNLLSSYKEDDARIERLYLTVLSRKPTSAERKLMLAHVKDSRNASEAYEDIMFALLASTEFSTNH